MTAIQMNALSTQMWRDMGIIAENENMMKRAAKYLHKLVKELANDPTQMTKKEYFAMLDEAEQQIARGEGHEMLPNEDLTTFLRRRGYDI